MNKLIMIVDFDNENLIKDNVVITMWRAGSKCPNPTLDRAEENQVMQQMSKPKVTR